MGVQTTERFQALDGWRGVAALAVALHHFPALSSVYELDSVRNAWLFVDLFFLLSGFVIAANYRDRFAQGYSFFSFMWLRLGRLYPLHLAMLLCFLATELALSSGLLGLSAGGGAPFTGSMAPDGLVTSALLIQGMGAHDQLVWNGVAWSISTEFWMYALFAAVALGFARRLNLAMGVLIAAAIGLLALEHVIPEQVGRFVDFARCVYGFALGVLAHAAYRRLTARRSRSERAGAPRGVAIATALEAAASLLAILFVIYGVGAGAHLWAPIAFAPLLLIFAFDAGWISRVLQSRPFAFLGLVSYSIYLTHPFWQSRVMKPLGLILEKVTGLTVFGTQPGAEGGDLRWGAETWQGDLWTLLMLASVLAVSWATYRLIEAPGRSAMRRLLESRAAGRAARGQRQARSIRPE